MRIPFTKLHGLGNDFVLVDVRENSKYSAELLRPEVCRSLADRHRGVGFDQLILIESPSNLIGSRTGERAESQVKARTSEWAESGAESRAEAQAGSQAELQAEPRVRVQFANADGSLAEMCGNGMRAVGLWISLREKVESFVVETAIGLRQIDVRSQDEVRVEMGEPQFEGSVDLHGVAWSKVRIGNPHAVHLSADLQAADLDAIGPEMERDSHFPDRTNVEFVQIQSRSRFDLRVWERGAGWTQACGSGACASAAAAMDAGLVDASVEVNLPGGVLQIEWAGAGNSLFMTGPAREVFWGEWESDESID